MNTYYLMDMKGERRIIIDADIVKQVQARSWLEAKKLCGFKLSALEEEKLAKQIEETK